MPERWKKRARLSLVGAQTLFDAENWPGCANRAYYAAFQVGTAICLEHDDAAQFPNGWNNSTHDQLPDLLRNNGSIEFTARRRLSRLFNSLRDIRETADYRAGRTVDKEAAFLAIQQASSVFRLLKVEIGVPF